MDDGATRTPGLLDLQVNGYAGVDFNDAALTPDALDHALHAMLRSGVAHCLPTLITAPEGVLGDRLRSLDHAVQRSRLGPVMVLGVHLEGPFLNPAPGYAGCHPPEAMVPPDPALLARLCAATGTPIRLLTLAPEQPGALDLIPWARARGVVVALGHTAVDAKAVRAAVEAGATLSTHLGNAQPTPGHKFVNPLMAQLAEDGLTASFIADGLHVPPSALKVMLRAKGPGRSVLVTDAVSAAAAPPGPYGFAGMTVEHAADGSVRVPGGTVLAGSALRLDQAVRNVTAWGLASFEAAVGMASAGPEAILGMARETSEVVWDGKRTVREARVGELRVGNPPPPAD